MLVTNLTPWAGLDFSVATGEVVDLADDVAAARIAAGLAAPLEQPEEPAKRGPGRPRKGA